MSRLNVTHERVQMVRVFYAGCTAGEVALIFNRPQSQVYKLTCDPKFRKLARKANA